MKLPILLLGITVALVNAEGFENCPTCVMVNTTCYNVSFLFELEAPFRKRIVIPKMGILRSKNTLFFSFEPVFEDREYYKTGFVNLDDPSIRGIISGTKIEQVLNLGTFDIDQDNSVVYFGGNDGIFVLDSNSSVMSSYSSRGDTIMNIFYRSKVYFTKYNEKGITVKNGDNFRTLLEETQVNNFVVTKDYGFVYLNNTGLHVSKGGVVQTLSINPFFRGITIDLDGTVYTWWIDGIYKIVMTKNLEHLKLVRMVQIDGIGAMTFDNDNNVLFNVDRSLYVMKESINGCV